MSIHKVHSNRSPWRVVYRDADGRQRSKSFATHRDAKGFDTAIKNTDPAERVTTVTRTALTVNTLPTEGMLLRDWITEWFRNYGPTWAPKTLKDRANVTRLWVTPIIGDLAMDQLGPRLIRRYRSTLLDRGASNNRANVIITILSAVLSGAVEDGIIDMNPCTGIKRLPHHKKAIRPLTPLEVEAIRCAMPEPRDKIIISLIAYAGLRPGEVCGLQWENIRDGLILVDQSVQDAKIGPTKTKTTRTIRIMPSLQSDLDDYGRGPNSSFVVTGSKGGPLNFNIWGQRVFRAYVVDEQITPYVLRHTFASLALREGRSLPWIAIEMGHARPTTLLDHYAHLHHEAELATSTPMDVAIRDARSEASRPTQAAPASHQAGT
jgi:integrase